MRVPEGEKEKKACSRAQEVHGNGDKSRESGLPDLNIFSIDSDGTAQCSTKHDLWAAEQTLPMCGPPSDFLASLMGQIILCCLTFQKSKHGLQARCVSRVLHMHWVLMASLHNEPLVAKKRQPGGELKLHLDL